MMAPTGTRRQKQERPPLNTSQISGRRTLFEELYDRPDPRSYFRVFGRLDYQTPHHAQRVFRHVVHACQQCSDFGQPVTVMDIGCSYGINAALLNHHLSLNDLYAHYTDSEVDGLTTAELIVVDRAFYGDRRRVDAVPIIGVDVAANALAYCQAVGLLDNGFAENLEIAPPSPSLRDAARRSQLITVTGAVSFLSSRTFESLIDRSDDLAWVAAFVLRTDSYRSISDCFARRSMTTETLSQTFRQRRFTSAAEQQYAIDAVSRLGEDPAGKEADGYFHTTFHLSRDSEDATRFPLHDVVKPI